MVDNNELLGLVAEQSLKSSYREEAWILDAEHLDGALGIALSEYVDMYPERMHAIIYGMLENANFHRLNGIIDKWFEKNMK